MSKRHGTKRQVPSHQAKGKFVVPRAFLTDPRLNSSQSLCPVGAAVWIVCEASFEPRVISTPNGEIYLARGELSFSWDFLSKAFGWSREAVRYFLDKIDIDLNPPRQPSQQPSVQPSAQPGQQPSQQPIEAPADKLYIRRRIECGRTVITVCNYDELQNFMSARTTAKASANMQGATQPTTQPTTLAEPRPTTQEATITKQILTNSNTFNHLHTPSDHACVGSFADRSGDRTHTMTKEQQAEGRQFISDVINSYPKVAPDPVKVIGAFFEACAKHGHGVVSRGIVNYINDNRQRNVEKRYYKDLRKFFSEEDFLTHQDYVPAPGSERIPVMQ